MKLLGLFIASCSAINVRMSAQFNATTVSSKFHPLLPYESGIDNPSGLEMRVFVNELDSDKSTHVGTIKNDHDIERKVTMLMLS